jgi:hypothetical protein
MDTVCHKVPLVILTLGMPHKNEAFSRAFWAIITHFFLSSSPFNCSKCVFAIDDIALGLLALARPHIWSYTPETSVTVGHAEVTAEIRWKLQLWLRWETAKGHLCLLGIACVLVLEIMCLGSCLAAEYECAGACCNEWLVTPTDFLFQVRSLPPLTSPSQLHP